MRKGVNFHSTVGCVSVIKALNFPNNSRSTTVEEKESFENRDRKSSCLYASHLNLRDFVCASEKASVEFFMYIFLFSSSDQFHFLSLSLSLPPPTPYTLY